MGSKYIVLVGYLSSTKGDKSTTTVLTPAGDELVVESSSVKMKKVAEPGKGLDDSLVRLYLDPDTEISIKVKASLIRNQGWDTFFKSYDDVGPGQGDTITKWLDDGGTISKSRDDLLSSGV